MNGLDKDIAEDLMDTIIRQKIRYILMMNIIQKNNKDRPDWESLDSYFFTVRLFFFQCIRLSTQWVLCFEEEENKD